MYSRYIVKQNIQLPDGNIPSGSQIDFINGKIYFNGGMIEPSFYNILYDLIEGYEKYDDRKLLKRVIVPYNKA